MLAMGVQQSIITCPHCGRLLCSRYWDGYVARHAQGLEPCSASGLKYSDALDSAPVNRLSSSDPEADPLRLAYDPPAKADCPECGRFVDVRQEDRTVPEHKTYRGVDCTGSGKRAVNVRVIYSGPARRGGGSGPIPCGFHN